MIDKVKFYKGMTLLKASFPQSKIEITEQTLEVWQQALDDLTDEMFEIAVLHLIRSAKFYPTIAEIREIAFSLCTTEHSKTGDEAWEEVMQEISKTGAWGEPHFQDEITARAVRNLGWKEICGMDISQLDIVRAQFRNLYNNLKERAKKSDSLKSINPEFHALLNEKVRKLT